MQQLVERRMLIPKMLGCAALIAAGLPLQAAADSLETLPYALSGGTPSVDVLARYEYGDQNNALESANAATIRARLGYNTGKWNDLDLFTEFEGTFAFGGQDYNSTQNGKTNQVVIADPDGTELNQFFLRYTGLPATAIKLGRQRIKLDNDRFIGNVGWRQAEQTYDGYNIVSSYFSPKSTINYTYISNVNTIFYTDFAIRGHLVNLKYEHAKWLTAISYAYLLDFKQRVPAREDTATFGFRFLGSVPVGKVKLGYTAEFAKQQGYEDAPATVDAEYYLIEPAVTAYGITAKFGFEQLGSNSSGTYGFQTPLSTLHAFQGWADLFLNTPPTGIQDVYGSLGTTIEKVALFARYHDFEAEKGGAHYGNELDIQISRPIGKNLVALLKYADYYADSFAVDTRRVIAQLEYKF